MPYNNLETKGRPITIKDEGVAIATNVGSIDFAGAGVTGTASGSDVTETISGGSGTAVVEEVPTGTINGANTVFTLAHTPIAGTLRVYLNGARQATTTDYTLATATITFVTAPMTSSILFCDYEY